MQKEIHVVMKLCIVYMYVAVNIIINYYCHGAIDILFYRYTRYDSSVPFP